MGLLLLWHTPSSQTKPCAASFSTTRRMTDAAFCGMLFLENHERKGKRYVVRKCVISVIRSLCIPSVWQKGLIGVRKFPDEKAFVSIIWRCTRPKAVCLEGTHAGGFSLCMSHALQAWPLCIFTFGPVSPAAKRMDCKSVTSETPKVRVLPGPLSAPVSQLEEGAGLNPAQCEFESLREHLIRLCSRTGICGGLRTRAGPRSIASSTLARGTFAGVAELEYAAASNAEN